MVVILVDTHRREILKPDSSKIEFKPPECSELELVIQKDHMMRSNFKVGLIMTNKPDNTFLYYGLHSCRTLEEAEKEYDSCLKVLKSGEYHIVLHIGSHKAELLPSKKD